MTSQSPKAQESCLEWWSLVCMWPTCSASEKLQKVARPAFYAPGATWHAGIKHWRMFCFGGKRNRAWAVLDSSSLSRDVSFPAHSTIILRTMTEKGEDLNQSKVTQRTVLQKDLHILAFWNPTLKLINLALRAFNQHFRTSCLKYKLWVKGHRHMRKAHNINDKDKIYKQKIVTQKKWVIQTA